MFLRSLYGSALPQSLHPRSDAEIASYWDLDTKSSQEIAQETNSTDNRYNESAAITNMLLDDKIHRQQTNKWLAANRYNFKPFRVDDVELGTGTSPLSPSELISIAAAEIDETEEFPEFTLKSLKSYMLSLRSRPDTFLDRLRDIGMRRVLPSSSSQSVQSTKHLSSTRFLSLLRRIDELQTEESEIAGGLTYPQIHALPTLTYTSDTSSVLPSLLLSSDPLSRKKCAICLEEYEEGEELRLLQCFHYYHKNCIDSWLRLRRACPLCHFSVRVHITSLE